MAYSDDLEAERLSNDEEQATKEPSAYDQEVERFVDDDEQMTDFLPNDRNRRRSSSPSGSGTFKRALFLCAYTFFVALLAYLAFDQGYVVLAGSEASVTESVSPTYTAPAAATSTRPISAWSVAQREAEEMLSKARNRETAACLVPDVKGTQALLKEALAGKYKSNAKTANPEAIKAAKVPLPALNLGMPKCGTTSQQDFFLCAHYKASHSVLKDKSHQGLCMRDAARANVPVLEACTQGADALTEMDANSAFGIPYKQGPYTSDERRDDCFFPQLSLVQEFHDDDPNATFMLPFRPVKDWFDSVMNWGKGFGIKEIMACDLPNSPRGVPDITRPKEEIVAEIEQFICSHVIHVRNFVKDHPSHALIEYDLYDKPGTGKVLGSFFPDVKTGLESSDCWQHVAHKTDIHSGDKIVSF
jgi:hypothetical protein